MYDSWYEFIFEENLKEKCGNNYQIYDEDLNKFVLLLQKWFHRYEKKR